jgi:hypothetical protein
LSGVGAALLGQRLLDGVVCLGLGEGDCGHAGQVDEASVAPEQHPPVLGHVASWVVEPRRRRSGEATERSRWRALLGRCWVERLVAVVHAGSLDWTGWVVVVAG